MPFVITEPCVGVKDRSCVDACPVDCIYEAEEQLMIHPEECIDCYACLPTCPVDAIYRDDNVPEPWLPYVAKAVEWFAGNPDASGGAFASRCDPPR